MRIYEDDFEAGMLYERNRILSLIGQEWHNNLPEAQDALELLQSKIKKMPVRKKQEIKGSK